MDAQKLGEFISDQRKECGMTQSDLAQKLFVTDKAVSRWERGLGLPDINNLLPLAEALNVDIAELMNAKKANEVITSDDASGAVKNVLDIVDQKKEERKRVERVIGATATLVLLILLFDNAGIEGFIGVWLPCFGLVAGIALLVTAIIQKRRSMPIRRTVVVALLLLLIPILFVILFAMVGVLGIGPVAN
ncbi:helix-turn-helix domain-containing protein [Butyrivibrio sp. INlla14]|uniref:helix-turn-helix domain-containing protein n=1 Tax=Butyrivibrio sp. INlla14 TaxID=1520808 RepID=UPI0008770C13|nr:helix-turn-helix domain-containing protein [Butyrivibrio sp. INlla14]SCX96683.1 Transcriptional regulator, contains XRE-family HTH domain [Butyrivibrio sp. INlla14]